jgi:hypothetical protein
MAATNKCLAKKDKSRTGDNTTYHKRGLAIMPTSLIEECYRRAADARRLAETASMPSNKTNFLGMEQRWLVAAHSLTSERSFGGQPSVARIETPMAQQTMHVNEPKSQPAPRKGRRTKFTLERVQQIKNLVSHGKSREEIAGLIGVTVGSLQVTCSKLGISLRRFRGEAESNLQDQEVPRNRTGEFNPGSGETFRIGQLDQFLQPSRGSEVAAPRQEANDMKQTSIALKVRYKGHERATELSISEQMVLQLAFEAQVRDMNVGQLVAALIKATLEKDLCRQVLDGRGNQ